MPANLAIALYVGIPAVLLWCVLYWMAVFKGYDRYGRTWKDRQRAGKDT